MHWLVWTMKLLSAGGFFYYGLCLLFSRHMETEFQRYGLSQYRQLTGGLQLAGSLGLIAGFYWPLLTSLASLGLATLMALGLFVRVKVQDPLWQMLPAVFFLIVNALIFFASTR